MALGHSEERAQEIFMEMVIDQGTREALKRKARENVAKHGLEGMKDSKGTWDALPGIEDSE